MSIIIVLSVYHNRMVAMAFWGDTVYGLRFPKTALAKVVENWLFERRRGKTATVDNNLWE